MNSEKNNASGKKTPKQIAALVCVLLLVALYAATLILACLDFPDSGKLFMACLAATVGLPILCWIYIWLYGMVKGKHTIASPDIFATGKDADEGETNENK